MAIKIESQFNLHRRLGFIWSGIMGGQWAMTAEILSYVEGRELTVVCGGAGDLCVNAINARATGHAINVDASVAAIDYGLRIVEAISDLNSSKALSNTIASVIQINQGNPGVPRPLVNPSIPFDDYPFVSWKTSDDNLVDFYHSDGLEYLKRTPAVAEDKVGTSFFYLATPTVLPDDVLGKGLRHFYQLYDPEIEIGVNWSDPASEFGYITEMMTEIQRIDPQARVGFGVGEGDTPLGAYSLMLQRFGTTQTVLEKTFQGDGYQFTDWLLICDLHQ